MTSNSLWSVKHYDLGGLQGIIVVVKFSLLHMPVGAFSSSITLNNIMLADPADCL